MPNRKKRNPSSRPAFFAIAGLLAVLSAALAVAGVLRYAAPTETLTWSSGPPPSIREKAEEMIAGRRLSFRLTEAEIDALIKQHWKQRVFAGGYAEMTGAQFELAGNRLIARTTVNVAGRADIAVDHEFRLDWQAPDLVVTRLSSHVRAFELPKAWIRFDTMRVPLELDPRLPVAVKSVVFHDDYVEVQMRLRVPSLLKR